jgi:N-acetylglutamate synthase-like GNAT family acetyltransferase
LVDFIIRRATRNDFQAIRSLVHAVHINPTGLDWRRFLVAVSSDGALFACGQVKLHADGSRELASIAVAEQYRSQGLARSIINALLQLEPERPLYLMCRARLRPFYNKFGFHDVDLNAMPSYFRRIKHLEGIFNSKAQADDRMLVMRLD